MTDIAQDDAYEKLKQQFDELQVHSLNFEAVSALLQEHVAATLAVHDARVTPEFGKALFDFARVNGLLAIRASFMQSEADDIAARAARRSERKSVETIAIQNITQLVAAYLASRQPVRVETKHVHAAEPRPSIYPAMAHFVVFVDPESDPIGVVDAGIFDTSHPENVAHHHPVVLKNCSGMTFESAKETLGYLLEPWHIELLKKYQPENVPKPPVEAGYRPL